MSEADANQSWIRFGDGEPIPVGEVEWTGCANGVDLADSSQRDISVGVFRNNTIPTRYGNLVEIVSTGLRAALADMTMRIVRSETTGQSDVESQALTPDRWAGVTGVPFGDWFHWTGTSTTNWSAPSVEEIAERQKTERKSYARAKRLFKRLITPEQRRQWKAYDEFGVIGSKGGRYLIMCDKAQLWGTSPAGRSQFMTYYCIQPDLWDGDSVPEYDKFLSWKMYIEANEPLFLRTAVASRYYKSADLTTGETYERTMARTNEILAEREVLTSTAAS